MPTCTLCTVFTRILAAATINFSRARVRLLIEGGSYSRAALIKNNAHAQLTYARANAIYNKPRSELYARASIKHNFSKVIQ